MGVKLSLCMIAKDEEKFLSDCLRSVKDLVDEIILVDTGSNDKTIEIAESFGAKVFHQEWDDDFSKPRNISLRKATGDWILVLDPDETIALRDHKGIKDLLSGNDGIAYSMITRNYTFTKKPFLEFMDSNDEYADMNKGMPFFWVSDKIRIFPNNKNIEFRGPVHELVEDSIKEEGISIESINLPVHHYNQLDGKKSRYKRFFYMNITRKKALREPENPKVCLELGREYFNLRLYHRAIRTFRKGLKLSGDNKLSHQLNMQTGNAYVKMKKPDEAEKYFENARKLKEMIDNNEQKCLILSYHDIGDNESEWCLSEKKFREQVMYLKENGYEFVTLDNIDYGKKSVALTFDDGRLSAYKTVMPFLNEIGVKATFFITTDWIDGKNIPESESYSEFMEWKQVKELSKKKHLISSHTVSHRDLNFLDSVEVKREFELSKKILEEKLGRKIEILSYPFGHYNDEVVKLANESGYTKAVTEDSGFCKENNFRMPRIYLLRNSTFDNFKRILPLNQNETYA